MAVRNIRSIGNTKPIPIFSWIPPINDCNYKITVTRKDGTIDDITDLLYIGETNEWNDSINDKIGNFTFTIPNHTEQFTGIWTGDEEVLIYQDYDTTATTLRFKGKIEKVTYPNNKVQLIGRGYALSLMNINVTFPTVEDSTSFTLNSDLSVTAETSVILSYIIGKFATQFTTNNVNVSNKSITVKWNEKTLFECITELVNASGFDFYVDSSLDAHYFESGSVKNDNECVVHDLNIYSIDDFGQDLSVIKNKVKVRGGDIAGCPLIWTSKSEDSDYGITSPLGVRDFVVKDENISNSEQAKDRADAELIFALNPNMIGECECKGLATLQPGEQIKISAPYSNIAPSYYTISSYKHKYNGDMRTTLMINKESLKIQRILKNQGIYVPSQSISDDTMGFDYSLNYDFNNESGIHTSTIISGGYLKTKGASSGIWESDVYETNFDITAVSMAVNGDNLSTIKIFISLDGGSVYRQIYGQNVPSLQIITPGRAVKIKVYFNSADTSIRGLALLYK